METNTTETTASNTPEYRFTTQVQLSKFAYDESEGDFNAMVKLVAELLQSDVCPIKESKRAAMRAGGEREFVKYAKVKTKEYFTRKLKVPVPTKQ